MNLTTLALVSLFSSAHAAVGICRDLDRSCWNWAQAQECEQDHVRQLCPVSCGVIPHLCVDASEHCVLWANEGQCQHNTQFMHMTCPIACGIGRLKCFDIDPTSCPFWANEGELDDNREWMDTNCPVSSGV